MTSMLLVATIVFAFDDTPTKEVIAKVKDATVFLSVERVKGNIVDGNQGTGFVAARNGDRAIIVTNRHVVEFDANPAQKSGEARSIAPDIDFDAGLAGLVPGRGNTLAREAKVYFRPGTQQQFRSIGKVLFVAKDTDLALISVSGIEKIPAPLELEKESNLTELKPVYFAGFPFGSALGVAGQAPAPTVHKALVGSLRQNTKGQIIAIQINGELNHGNSGGPLVNEAGKIIGVIRSKIESTQIGFGIASSVVAALLKPRILGIELHPLAKSKDTPVGPDTKVTAMLLASDTPWRSIQFISRPKELRNHTHHTELKRDPASQSAMLKIDGDTASGELSLHSITNDDRILCQVVAIDMRGRVYRSEIQEMTLKGATVAIGEDKDKEKKKRTSITGKSGLTARERLHGSKDVDKKMKEAKTARERLNESHERDKKTVERAD